MLKRIDCETLKIHGLECRARRRGRGSQMHSTGQRCAAPGRYELRNGTDVLARAFDGPSFFEEGGGSITSTSWSRPADLKEGAAFACSVVAKIPRTTEAGPVF